MEIQIKKVISKHDLGLFIGFPYKLYKGNKYWCPQMRMDEKKTLSRKTNPAFDFCEAEYWLALKDKKVVGRVAGIINQKANERWNEKLVRFGWIDFIDDPEVSEKLVETVENWGKEKGMTGIHGPLGFSDMDNEGMLIKGFEELATLASIYNYPYYVDHMAKLGFEKAADWVQYELKVPDKVPEKFERISSLVIEKYNLRLLRVKKAKELLPYAGKMFMLLNKAFDNLYGFTALSQKQMDMYVKAYFGFIQPKYVSFVIDQNDDVVGFGISVPSLTRALQKSNGRLFPIGFIYLLRAMKKCEIIDMYINGVHPSFQNRGVVSLYYLELMKAYINNGIKIAVTNPQLEDNANALTIWKNFEGKQHLTRRCWIRHF